MPPVHGKNAHLTIDDSGGTPVDVSAKARNVDWPDEVEEHDTTAFGAGARTFKSGLNASPDIAVELFWDATLEAHLTGILGKETTTLVFGPEGNTTGQRRRTAETILKTLGTPVPVGDLIIATATFRRTGAVTYDTYP